MKRIYLTFVMVAMLCSCGGKHTHTGHEHEHEHDHDHTEAHAHAHEHEHDHDHDHEGHDHEGHNHEAHEHDHGHEHAAGEIVFKKANAEAVGLMTEKVAPAPFAEVIKTSGQIQAAQGSESVLVATVPGIVTLGSTRFVDGTAVRKGETVLSLASENLSDGDVASRAKIAYETAQKEYERMSDLVGDKIVSQKEFEQAKLAYENAKVAYEAVKGKHSAKGVAVTAPIQGFLKNILVKEGDYATVGQPLATIAQNNRLVLKADVSEKYYAQLPLIRSAYFKTPYDDQVYQLDQLNGRLLSYGRSSGSNSFYVPVLFEFDNKGAIIPGSFVEIYLLGKQLENVISVPMSALVEEQGSYWVYIRLDEDCYKKQLVTIGADNGKQVQILSGLKADDEVVTQGAYQIKLASASNAIPAHSHSH